MTRKTTWLTRLLPLLLLLSGCAECGEEQVVPTGRDAGPIDVQPAIAYANLDDLQQVVVLGDTLAAGYGVPISANFVSLLLTNDDESFPEFVDQDLDTQLPGSDRFNLATDGARVESLLQVQLPNVPENATMIIVAVGIEDYLDRLGDDAISGTAEAAVFGATLDQVLASLRSVARFPVLPHVYLVNLIDLSDGAGDLASLVGGGTWADAQAVLDAYNTEIADAAVMHSAHLIDVHQAFLGHGGHHDDALNPHHDASDPSDWLQRDLRRPNRRGHSEIRRLLLDKILTD